MIDDFIQKLNNPILSNYIKNDSDLYEDLLNIIRLDEKTDRHTLYEVRQNTEYVVNDLSGNLIKTGRINLNGYQMKSSSDIVSLSKILNNKKFETTRVLYTRDGEIIGQDAITIDIPNSSYIASPRKDNSPLRETIFLINQKSKRLGANGVYHIHNHPSGDSSPSPQDKQAVKILSEYVNNFICGYVIGIGNYTKLVPTEYGVEQSTREFDDRNVNKTILNNDDKIVSYLRNLNTDSDSSYLVYLDTKWKLISVQKVLNKEFSDKNIFNWIKNEKQKNGAYACIAYTEDEELFEILSNKCGSNRLFFNVLFGDSPTTFRSALSEREFLDMPEDEIFYRSKKL